MFEANIPETKGRKFEERFIKQNRDIDELEGRVSFQENTINRLLIKCNHNEQYSRRRRRERLKRLFITITLKLKFIFLS